MIYTSIENDKIKNIKKLNMSKNRDSSGLFLVEGLHLVFEAYKLGFIEELILEENETLDYDVPTIKVSANVLKYISELETPPSVMAVCHKKEHFNELGNKILILDGIQDPGNLGTIIRSSVAFNVSTIILSNDTVDLYNSKVIRASQGLLFHINIIQSDLITIIPSLKENDYKILGTKVTDGNSLKSIDKFEKVAIIVGNEGKGIRDNILNLCDQFIYIDMNKDCESLNAGVAASIILYELDK